MLDEIGTLLLIPTPKIGIFGYTDFIAVYVELYNLLYSIDLFICVPLSLFIK
jgi:hypothetical protein